MVLLGSTWEVLGLLEGEGFGLVGTEPVEAGREMRIQYHHEKLVKIIQNEKLAVFFVSSKINKKTPLPGKNKTKLRKIHIYH